MTIKTRNINNNFADRLKKLRLEKSLSQTDLANELGVHPNHISRYERGQSRPNTKFLKALSDFFDVSIDYLYDGDEQNAAVADFEDKELLTMFREIENFSQENKEHIKALINAFIKAEKHKQLASQI